MPDNRYSGYEQRPVQGRNNMRNNTQQGSAARPQQPRPQGTGAQRPVGSAPRQAAPQRGYAASGAPTRAPQQTARPQSAAGQPRPAARPASQQPRPQNQGAARPRPAQPGAQQRRPGQYAPVRQTAPTRNSRPSSGAGKGAPKGRGSGNGGYGMPPALKAVCFVLVTAMLMTTSVLVAAKIHSNQPRPVISMSLADPMAQTQTSGQPVSDATAEPVSTGVPVASATDAPAAPTDAPAVPTDTPAASTNVPAAPVGSRSATIRAIGDVIIDQETLDNCAVVKNEQYDFSPLFELISGVMSDADWTMINIEGTLRKHKYGYMGFPQFSTPHTLLDDLKAVGVDMLTMCNNHALDGWYDGLKMSLDYADAAGLAHVGAYRTQAEHDTPEIYDIGGIKVGMLNYTQYTNGMAEKSDAEATIYGMRLMAGADYEGDIADLKQAGAEFTIAIMHWGEEYIREPQDDIEAIARRLVAAGADLVIGGHPHVVQPAEYITATQADGTQNTALVIYSLGNFYSEHRHKNKAYTDNGVIFEFTLSDDGQGGIKMSSPAFIPIYMWQNEGAGAYEFRAVPSGVYLNNPPAGMSSSEYERMTQSYYEIVELVGGVIEIRAD